eukprot:CAMPEP_0203813216 /NCGR_PEP_ID=MMETSP0115-20131106/4594_1 /ASSEMBLY_ACC=CAM_ASM_000227 /TAXON_ID=33651 /ORGANISM="Bicosoecid sp, Strain ms1" /LENGTH=1379 /DNA_ID=CAMNT_0050722079 /DNA_START=92 /DNA_END=4229 /DNA_ORIENTATION=+
MRARRRLIDARLSPSCSRHRTALRVLYAVAGLVVAALFVNLELLTGDLGALGGVDAVQSLVTPACVALLAAGLGRSLLGWANATTRDHGNHEHPHSAVGVGAVLALLVVLFVVGAVVDRPVPVAPPPPPLPEPVPGGGCMVVDVPELASLPNSRAPFMGRPDPGLFMENVDDAMAYLASMDRMTAQIAKFQPPTVSDADNDRCIQSTMNILASYVVRNCDGACATVQPCASHCDVFVDACPWLTSLLPVLADDSTAAAFRGILPPPQEYGLRFLKGLVQCLPFDIPINDEGFMMVDGTRECSGAEFTSRAGADAPCDLESHLAKQAAYEASLVAEGDPSARDAWRMRRIVYRITFTGLVWAAVAVDVVRAHHVHHSRFGRQAHVHRLPHNPLRASPTTTAGDASSKGGDGTPLRNAGAESHSGDATADDTAPSRDVEAGASPIAASSPTATAAREAALAAATPSAATRTSRASAASSAEADTGALLGDTTMAASVIKPAWAVNAGDEGKEDAGTHEVMAAATVDAKGKGAVSMHDLRPGTSIDVDAPVLSDSDAEGDDAAITPPTFDHVVGARGLGLLLMMLFASYLALRTAAVAHEAGNTSLAWSMALVALLVALMTLPGIFAWDATYAGAVRMWRFGSRRYAFTGPREHRSCLTRLTFASQRLVYEYDMTFGIAGAYYEHKLFVSECVEILTQLLGVMSGAPTTPASVVLIILALLALNVVGACVLHFVPKRCHGKEVRTTFDLLLDLWWALWNSLNLQYESATFFQALAVAMPLVLGSLTLRELADFMVFDHAQRDCLKSQLPRGFQSAKLVGSRRRLRGFGTVYDSDFAASRGVEGARRGGRRCVAVAVFSFAVVGASIALLAATAVRIDATTAKCADSVGPLWDGVAEQDKQFFPNGLFGELECGLEGVSHLGLAGSHIVQIDERVLNFPALTTIDARGCPELRHVTPAVTELPAMTSLMLSGSPAASVLSWRGYGFTDLHPLLLQQTELVDLDLSDNAFTEVPESIAGLSRLQRLNLTGNALTSSVFVALDALRELRDVRLAHNDIEGFDEPVADRIIRRWTHLDLRHNVFTTVHAPLFVPAKEALLLEGNPVSFVSLIHEGITPDIPVALMDLPVSELALGINAIENIDPSIVKLAATLEYLRLDQNVLTSDSLPGELVELPHLRYFGISGNPVCDDDGRAPLVLFEMATRWLDLTCVRLSELSPAVWDMPNLDVLEVKMNPLTTLPPLSEAAKATLELVILNLRLTQMATLPAVVLEAPLIDTLLIFTFSSALADADVIAGMIDEVEAASGGRLFCVSLDIDGNENTLHCEDLAGPMQQLTAPVRRYTTRYLGLRAQRRYSSTTTSSARSILRASSGDKAMMIITDAMFGA